MNITTECVFCHGGRGQANRCNCPPQDLASLLAVPAATAPAAGFAAWLAQNPELPGFSIGARGAAVWDAALSEIRAKIRIMQDNLETFGPYAEETARIALDGAVDAIDDLMGSVDALKSAAQGCAK